MNIQRLQGDYVLLRADSLRLLVAQTDVDNIAHLQDRNVAAQHAISEATELYAQNLSNDDKDNADDANKDNADSADVDHAHDDSTHNSELSSVRFVALSENLSLLADVPHSRFVMTSHPQTPDRRWCWSEVQLFNNLQITAAPIPPILRTTTTPITDVVTLADGHQAFICQFDALLHHLTGGIQ